MNATRQYPQAIPKAMAVGVGLSLLAITLGFALGVAFGAKETAIKEHLDRSGTEVLATVYQGDASAKDAVVAKSWSYMKRAHLHGGAIGATAIGCILVLYLMCPTGIIAQMSGVALGSGSFIYALFWMLAGLTAPGAGGTAIAKESLSFVALPGAGLCMLGLLGTIFSVLKASVVGAGNV